MLNWPFLSWKQFVTNMNDAAVGFTIWHFAWSPTPYIPLTGLAHTVAPLQQMQSPEQRSDNTLLEHLKKESVGLWPKKKLRAFPSKPIITLKLVTPSV